MRKSVRGYDSHFINCDSSHPFLRARVSLKSINVEVVFVKIFFFKFLSHETIFLFQFLLLLPRLELLLKVFLYGSTTLILLETTTQTHFQYLVSMLLTEESMLETSLLSRNFLLSLLEQRISLSPWSLDVKFSTT